MSNLKKKDGLLVSQNYSAVSGHGRVALFLNLCAVSDVKSVCFFLAVVSQYSVRAPSECLAERNLFRSVAGSGIAEFIYLGTLISNDNSVEKEIQRRILAGSRPYFAAISLFRIYFYPELPKFYYMRH